MLISGASVRCPWEDKGSKFASAFVSLYPERDEMINCLKCTVGRYLFFFIFIQLFDGEDCGGLALENNAICFKVFAA